MNMCFVLFALSPVCLPVLVMQLADLIGLDH